MYLLSSFVFLLIAIGFSLCDVRYASKPRAGFAVVPVQFVNKSVIYMEPSDFKYQLLKQQRDGGAYDEFLRSSIDNEQDKRNFNTEAGRDQLPFRSYEGAATDVSNTVQTKIPDGAPGPVLTVNPGEFVVLPLRWNNPHASEVELNIWIMNVPHYSPIVVPIKKPVCGGEGHQDTVLAFIVPIDFNALGTKIPGFTGCKKEGDCVLQMYAHSVEPRTYATGTPIVITGTVPPSTATFQGSQIEPAREDVGLDSSQLTRDVCLSSSDPSADIQNAIPRTPRLISDVFNHAYQSSDYSPYSGQQPEAISKNLQAACIVNMIPANGGELGQALLKQRNPQAARFAANLRNKVRNLIQKYEGLTNKIIAAIGDKQMKNIAKFGQNYVQKLAECFRCAETASTTATRLTSSTYVPSFQLPAIHIQAAKDLVPNQYKGLISDNGIVQIYMAVLRDLSAEFTKAAREFGLLYQPAMIKSRLTTMPDVTQFKKMNAQGQRDNGLYAARQAQAALDAAASSVWQIISGVPPRPTPPPLPPTTTSIPPIIHCDSNSFLDYDDRLCKPMPNCSVSSENEIRSILSNSDLSHSINHLFPGDTFQFFIESEDATPIVRFFTNLPVQSTPYSVDQAQASDINPYSAYLRFIDTSGRSVFLIYQSDGNLCAYLGSSPSCNFKHLWCSGTNNQLQCQQYPCYMQLEMRDDGNLCFHIPVESSEDEGAAIEQELCLDIFDPYPGSYLTINNDGQIAIVKPSDSRCLNEGDGSCYTWTNNVAPFR